MALQTSKLEDESSKDLLHRQTHWQAAARHWQGKGLEHGFWVRPARLALKKAAKRSPQEAGLLRVCLTRGLWSGQRLISDGYAMDAPCLFCGAVGADVEQHRLWTCPVVNALDNEAI